MVSASNLFHPSGSYYLPKHHVMSSSPSPVPTPWQRSGSESRQNCFVQEAQALEDPPKMGCWPSLGKAWILYFCPQTHLQKLIGLAAYVGYIGFIGRSRSDIVWVPFVLSNCIALSGIGGEMAATNRTWRTASRHKTLRISKSTVFVRDFLRLTMMQYVDVLFEMCPLRLMVRTRREKTRFHFLPWLTHWPKVVTCIFTKNIFFSSTNCMQRGCHGSSNWTPSSKSFCLHFFFFISYSLSVFSMVAKRIEFIPKISRRKEENCQHACKKYNFIFTFFLFRVVGSTLLSNSQQSQEEERETKDNIEKKNDK